MFHDDFSLEIVSIIVAIGSIIFTVWKTRPIERKTLEHTVLLQVFQLLSDPEVRKVRGEVFDKYFEYVDSGRKFIIPDNGNLDKESKKLKEKIGRVESAFDKVGVLVVNKHLDQKLFLDMYAGMVYRTWKILEDDIKPEQARNPEVCKWFEKLNEMAVEYFLEQGQQPPPPYRK